MPDDLLTIGRFARRCRLSVKQLRHYDELGLLPPAHVDAATGYRYYAPDQARDALTIALLRDVDLPLAVIARALAAGPDRRAGILRAERDRLAERISRDQARLGLLDRLAEGGGLPGYEVTLTREPERRLAVARAACPPTEIGRCVGELVARLLPALAAAGVPWRPPLYGLYPLDLAERTRIAVGADVPSGTRPPGPEHPEQLAQLAHQGLAVEVLPAGPVAETTHVGPYAELPLAYHALLAAVHERGLRPLAPVREAYLVGPAEAAPDDLTTRLVLPVQPDRPDRPVPEDPT